jgi:hypothetical protein
VSLISVVDDDHSFRESMRHTTLDQSERAVQVCLEYQAHLGVEWLAHPTQEQALAEYQRIWSWLDGRNIEDLIELPLMNDPAILSTLDVLTEVVPPALFTDRNLLSLVICRMVNLSLEHGDSDGSCPKIQQARRFARPTHRLDQSAQQGKVRECVQHPAEHGGLLRLPAAGGR